MMEDKEIKLQLLEELMSLMDESVAKRMKPGGDDPEVEVTAIEQKEMPISEVKDMVKEKMSGASDPSLEMDDDADDEDEMMAMEDDEEESEDYGDEPGLSMFEKKLNELKRKKLAEKV